VRDHARRLPPRAILALVRVVLVALLIAISAPAWAEEIKEIQVDENTKTTDDTVALICRIDVGDDWEADMIEICRKRLISSGLFRDDPTVFSEPHKSGSGVKVTIVVHDKHSWVIAPAFYTQPTNIGGGVGFGENNLFGKNQKLLLYGQIATGDSFFIGAWVIPNLGGTRWYAQLDTFLKSARQFEYAPPHKYLQTDPDAGANRAIRESRLNYLNGGVKLGIELFRGFKIDARLRGARVSYGTTKLVEGATLADVDPSGATTCVEGSEATGDCVLSKNGTRAAAAPGDEGKDISTEFTMSIDRRANYYGVSTGYKYSASFEKSALGSDFRYYLAGLGIYRGEQVLSRHNLVFRGSVGYGFHLPFQQEYLTGGTTMRGWLNGQFRGDFKAIANLEYSVPFFTIKGFGVRLLAFWDSAYTTFLNVENPQRNYLPYSKRTQFDVRLDPQFPDGNKPSKFQQYMSPFKNSVGIGTRFYLRQIVLPLLGLDFGYGLEARDFQIYLAIGLTD
jgi:outer membrane protein insertion porin family